MSIRMCEIYIFPCLTQMGGFDSSHGEKAATLQEQKISQGSKAPTCLQKCWHSGEETHACS